MEKYFTIRNAIIIAVVILLLYFLLFSKRKKIYSLSDESGYGKDEIFGGKKVIRLDCMNDKMPTSVPADSVIDCMSDYEAQAQRYDDYEIAIKKGDRVEEDRLKRLILTYEATDDYSGSWGLLSLTMPYGTDWMR